MDAKTYQRVREHFLRLHELSGAEIESELARLESAEPAIAAEVRKLLPGESGGEDDSDGLESAINLGLAEGARGLVPSLQLTPGTSFGNFTITSYVDGGGFGEVYLAKQRTPSREVALKIIKPGMDSARVIRRFEQEREALARMDHPGVARFFEAGATPPELGSRPYFAMEFIHGPKITDYCERENCSVEARIELFIMVCSAVQHAHAKGVVHRDLKPSNILIPEIDGQAQPKVIDFGIAKALDHRLGGMSVHTVEGQFLGTPAYMSPEQAGGGDIDTSTDVYALGVVLYELLTGVLPFDSKNLGKMPLTEVQRIIRESMPTRPSQQVLAAGRKVASEARDRVAKARLLRQDLDHIVMQCLKKEPQRRYPTANALAEDLRRFLRHEPIEAGPPSRAYRFRKSLRRHRVPAAIGTSIFLVLIVAVIALWSAWLNNKRLLDAQAANAVVQAERDIASDRARIEAAQREEAERQLQAKLAELQDVELVLVAREAEVAATSEQLQAMRTELDTREAELRQLEEEVAQARQSLDESRADLDRAFEQIAEASRDRQAAQAATAQAQAALERQREEGLAAMAALNADIERRQREIRDLQRLYAEAERSIRMLAQSEQLDAQTLQELAYSERLEGPMRAQLLDQLVGNALAEADFDAAIEHQLELVALSLDLYGSDTVEMLRERLSLVDLLLRAQRFAEAQAQLEMAQQVKDRNPQRVEPVHSDVLLAAAATANARGERDRAIEAATRAIRLRTLEHGAFDHRTLAAVCQRGMVHQAAGRTSDAIADYRTVIRQNDAGFSEETRPWLAIACNNLAVLMRDRDEMAQAEILFERAVRVAQNSWGPRDWRTALVEANHGYTLGRLQRFTPAAAKLQAAQEVLYETLGPDDRETRAAWRSLRNLYIDRNAAEDTTRYNGEVEAWQRRLDEGGMR